MSALPGWFWRAFHRSANRWWDARARLLGACNADTWHGGDRVGGYAHWRCGRPRGHGGRHRFVNSVWSDGAPPVFDPVEPGETGHAAPFAFVTRRRYMIDTLRRARARRRTYERALEARMAKRWPSGGPRF